MSYQPLETMADEEPSINIPSLLTLAVVSFFVIRWFLNRDSEPGAGGAGGGSGRSRARGNAVDPAQVEQISQMFPQLNARDIMWDLQRNGGSVAATTERILSGRGLEVVSSPCTHWCVVYCLGCIELIVLYSPRRHSSLKSPSLPLHLPQRHNPYRHLEMLRSRKDRTSFHGTISAHA